METINFNEHDYSYYTAKDFLSDDLFIQWARHKGENKDLDDYWRNLLDRFPGITGEFDKAADLIKVLSSQEVFIHEDGRKSNWSKIEDRIDSTNHLRIANRVLFFFREYRKVAAVILTLLLVSAGITGGFFIGGKYSRTIIGNTYTEVHTNSGQKTVVTLPDHSTVWMNSKTTLRYSNNFNINNRDVFLEGEAYFDITKSKSTFTVSTSSVKLMVLGTAFNLKCYADEPTVEATLVRGSLKIEKISASNGQKEEIILKPSQKVVFTREINSMSATAAKQDLKHPENDNDIQKIKLRPVKQVDLYDKIETEESTSWKDGYLLLKGETLKELAKKLERRYDVVITFENDAVKNYRYSGKLRELSIKQVLDAMMLTSPITYRLQDEKVFINENKEARKKFQNIAY